MTNLDEEFRRWETLALIIEHAKIIAEQTKHETFSETKIPRLKKTIRRMQELTERL